MKTHIATALLTCFFLISGSNLLGQQEPQTPQKPSKEEKALKEEQIKKQKQLQQEMEVREAELREREFEAQERAAEVYIRAEDARADAERSRARARESYRTSIREGRSTGVAFASPSTGTYIFKDQGGSTSQLNLSKHFEDKTSEFEGTFTVNDQARYVMLNMTGMVKTGEIIITIYEPAKGNKKGEVLKEVKVNEAADVNFSQHIRISEDETKYYGDWIYAIETKHATGHYSLSIQTR